MIITKSQTSAATEYEAAYKDYEAATRMNVATPEGAGTFGGVWGCDPWRLLRSLATAAERLDGVCAAAVTKVVAGKAVTVAEWGYGDLAGAPVADLYKMANGFLRDRDGRYLSAAENNILMCIALGTETWSPRTPHVIGRVESHPAKTELPRGHLSPGHLVQDFIDGQAGSQIARTLTKPYLVGWPVCTQAQKDEAHRRVARVYRTLADAFAATA